MTERGDLRIGQRTTSGGQKRGREKPRRRIRGINTLLCDMYTRLGKAKEREQRDQCYKGRGGLEEGFLKRLKGRRLSGSSIAACEPKLRGWRRSWWPWCAEQQRPAVARDGRGVGVREFGLSSC